MIELNSKTQQDFLNREWVQRLLDTGVDMSDAKYCIYAYKGFPEEEQYVALADDVDEVHDGVKILCPTYTASELLYKLPEWILPTIEGVPCTGELSMAKVDGKYNAWYSLSTQYMEEAIEKNIVVDMWIYLHASEESLIESLASLLIQCHKKDIGIKAKDIGNISGK